MRSEKLAAPGSMVSGVAHELNTPIGNSLMVASHLVRICLKMKESIRAGLNKSVLDEFVTSTDSAGDVLVRNLGKAAELVSGFKQVLPLLATEQAVAAFPLKPRRCTGDLDSGEAQDAQ